jgi:phosphoglycolate phosphatase
MDFSRYRAFIFDFDYTLCDATAGIVRSYNGAFRQFGYSERGEDEIRATVGLTVADSFM